MAVEVGRNYLFEEFRLEPEKRVLSRDEMPIRLANRPFQLLLFLIENRERIVTRDELLEKFWDGRAVYDEALTKAVGAIRKALREPHENPRFIETRWAGGYRFIGSVEEQFAAPPTFVEIEKTREVKILIEESGFDSSEKIIPVQPRPAAALPAAPRRINWQAAGVFGVLTIFVVTGLIFLRFGSTSNKTQSAEVAPIRSVAVLPLKNLTASAENDYFCDGMTESLIGAFSKIENLKVISRNSVAAFKNRDADPREIAERLGVAAVLEGSLRENGERVRVEVRLVNAADGQILWSAESVERARRDSFEIQNDIARSAATRLRLKLTDRDEKRLARQLTTNAEAYQAYLKGRHFWRQKTPEGLAKSRQFFDEAIRLDPHYALPYAGLVDYHLTGIWAANFPPREAYENAKAATLKIIELDDQLPEAHGARGRIASKEWDWETMRREFEKAVELNPNDAHYWQGYAFYLLNVAGQPAEALTAMRRAAELDPLSPNINTDVGVMLNHAGRYDEAIEAFRKALEIDANYNDAFYNLGIAYERKGMMREAVKSYLTGWRLKGELSENRLFALETAFEQTEIEGFWRKRLEFFEQAAKAGNAPPSPFLLAKYKARFSERDAAFANLEKSYAARESYLVALKSDFDFESIRNDPRFSDLLRRVGLEK